MSLLNRVAERIPEILNEAIDVANELIIAPNPNIIAPVNNVVTGLGFSVLVVFGIVSLLAGITIWQTIKLYKPKILLRF